MEHDAIITEAVLLQKVIKEVIKNSKTGGMFRGANLCTDHELVYVKTFLIF